MAIGGVVIGLTATGICGVIFRRATLVIGVIIFCRATLAIHGVVVYRTTTAMCSGHNNQPKEGCVAKMLATEAKQQATTSHRDKKSRGRHNTNTSAMTATRRWQ
jgi:hypothetical protein